MTPEGRVKAGVKKTLTSLGAWFYMPVQNGMGVVGIPDIIACIDGRLVAIETKAPGKLSNVTPNQANQLNMILAAGGVALVIDNPNDLLPQLAKYGVRVCPT